MYSAVFGHMKWCLIYSCALDIPSNINVLTQQSTNAVCGVYITKNTVFASVNRSTAWVMYFWSLLLNLVAFSVKTGQIQRRKRKQLGNILMTSSPSKLFTKRWILTRRYRLLQIPPQSVNNNFLFYNTFCHLFKNERQLLLWLRLCFSGRRWLLRIWQKYPMKMCILWT